MTWISILVLAAPAWISLIAIFRDSRKGRKGHLVEGPIEIQERPSERSLKKAA